MFYEGVDWDYSFSDLGKLTCFGCESRAKVLTLKDYNSAGSIAMKIIIIRLVEFSERRSGSKVSQI
jgi:hypothetical protein